MSGETRDLTRRLDAHLTDLLGRPVTSHGWKQFPSGFSWTTYGLSIAAPGFDGITELVLRLGPPNGLFAPYSAAPQFEALKAVEGTAVPAPRGFAWSDDAAILGAPFFVAERSPGVTVIPWDESGPKTNGHDGSNARAGIGEQFADILGELHALDWTRTGLARFGEGLTHENAAARAIAEWENGFRRWALRPHPMMHRVLAWVRAHQPRAPRLSIVHGDYRLGNFLERDGRITAILDWELVRLGDPHEDLAWSCLPQYRGGTELMSQLVRREELYARHEAKTGLAVDATAMHFYTILSLLKLAAVHMAGAHAFEHQGFHDMRMPAMATQIAPVLRQLEKALATAPGASS